ncbi:MAG: ChaN family lipoprotein [Azoarcus sp.]|jgi:uncharacterized iron-regulated protein|nr:ChaN family lipoprotein [Azoarcus sp.]
MLNRTVKHPRATWLNPNTGKLVEARKLMRRMARQDTVLLGETHNIAEIHRWQLHVIAALHMLRPNMMVGFEMFPRRLQPVLDEWVKGRLGTEEFVEKSEWYEVWGFPAEIYLPIFHFCRQQNVRMLALNCYRALVTRVGKEGWEAIPENERDGLTPSAPATDGYRRYLADISSRLSAQMPPIPGDALPRPINNADPDHFIRAQQTWDRAFACNIAHALNEARSEPPPLVVGIIGRGHLEYGHGTPYQLCDLGITKNSVLLTSSREEQELAEIKGIGTAIFRVDTPEPPAERLSRATARTNRTESETTP